MLTKKISDKQELIALRKAKLINNAAPSVKPKKV
jgi:hypothetical protein